jgi:hypothetical protein
LVDELNLGQIQTPAVALQDIRPDEDAAMLESGLENRGDFSVRYE